MKYRFKTKSKSYIHIHDKGIFLANDEGQAYRMLGTMQDISEKIQIEEDLIESNRFKESMESAMPGMLYVYDLKKQVIVYVNHNITRALGYDWEEIEGMGNNFLHNLIHPHDLPGYQDGPMSLVVPLSQLNTACERKAMSGDGSTAGILLFNETRKEM